MTRICRYCFVEKPITDFYISRSGTSYRFHKCKACSILTTQIRRSCNPEHYKEYFRNWQKSNPEKISHYNRKRKMSLRGAVGEGLTQEEWEDMQDCYDYRCAYCMQEKPLTQDHIIPLSKGGLHTKENIVPACQSCNSKKSTSMEYTL